MKEGGYCDYTPCRTSCGKASRVVAVTIAPMGWGLYTADRRLVNIRNLVVCIPMGLLERVRFIWLFSIDIGQSKVFSANVSESVSTIIHAWRLLLQEKWRCCGHWPEHQWLSSESGLNMLKFTLSFKIKQGQLIWTNGPAARDLSNRCAMIK